MTSENQTLEGGCSCGNVRYKITPDPIIVHCCHCRSCQRQTGTAFALNALYWTPDVSLTKGEVEEIVVPSPSGKGQKIARCPNCKVAVWSNYFMGGVKDGVRFIRVGSLDDPDQLPPDVHIFVEDKQPWVTLPEGANASAEFYDLKSTWKTEQLIKLQKQLAGADQEGFS